MKQIGVKFCGGCNPEINRSELFKELKRTLPEGYQLVTGSPAGTWETALLVCAAARSPAPTARRSGNSRITGSW